MVVTLSGRKGDRAADCWPLGAITRITIFA
jgi:hypothetical protein